MAKKKAKITCPVCHAVDWRVWASKHCKECGAPYSPPKEGSGKGTGKGDKPPGQENSSSSGSKVLLLFSAFALAFRLPSRTATMNLALPQVAPADTSIVLFAFIVCRLQEG